MCMRVCVCVRRGVRKGHYAGIKNKSMSCGFVSQQLLSVWPHLSPVISKLQWPCARACTHTHIWCTDTQTDRCHCVSPISKCLDNTQKERVVQMLSWHKTQNLHLSLCSDLFSASLCVYSHFYFTPTSPSSYNFFLLFHLPVLSLSLFCTYSLPPNQKPCPTRSLSESVSWCGVSVRNWEFNWRKSGFWVFSQIFNYGSEL